MRDLERLDKRLGKRIVDAVDRLAATDRGDVKVLKGSKGEYRLRVGDWRVRFTRDARSRTMTVLRVLPRGGADRD